jgi:hypothetical protein
VADEASSSIVISAEPSEIMAVIADLPAYPDWSTGIKSATVEESYPDGRPKRATFVEYEWSGDERVDWKLVGSGTMLKSQVGSYTLASSSGGTETTYRLTVELKVPMLGMFKRKAEKVIIDTALKGLKKRVESR